MSTIFSFSILLFVTRRRRGLMTLGFVSMLAFLSAGGLSLMAATNPIVLENEQPGTTQWNIYQNGRVANDIGKQIKGYASATSVNKGSSITFYVTVSPAQNYTINVYRMGWYQGLGGRLMQSLGPIAGAQQPACPTDATTGLIQCAWGAGATITVPTTWTTGVYLAVLTNANNYQSYIQFVVRDDSSHSDILYVEGVNTDQAYNNYPNDNSTGKSLYDYNSFGANTVAGSHRATKVSFDRPYADDGSGEFGSWSAYLISWLEGAGYDVSYSSDVDTQASGAQILNHKALIMPGHSEYWTMPMRNAVGQARDSGVSLGFLGGNSVYWQARFESSPLTMVPNRVLVCYKDQTIDPVQGPTTTILWRDPFIGQPEQSLIGIMYTVENVNSFNDPPATYVVTNSGNWAYAGTGFHDGDTVPRIVGYEVDRYFSQYPSPVSVAGTYNLLSHSPVVEVGTGKQDFADTSIYQAPSGAWVFAAGGNDWIWALSRMGFTDARIQQTATNILSAFIGLNTESVAATGGTPQSAAINSAYATALQATVKDAGSNPLSGVTVTFTAPGSGASGKFGGSATATAVTNASGIATAPTFTANAVAGGFTVTATVAGVATPANFSLTNTAGAAGSVAATGGTPQSAVINSAYATALQATVKDAGSNPLSGVTVTFTAPGSGASGKFGGSATATAVTNASGIATAPTFTANAVVGGFTVTATVAGVATPANFSLTNTAASAAITRVQGCSAGRTGAGPLVCTMGSNVTVGNYLVAAAVTSDSGRFITSVTHGADTCTQTPNSPYAKTQPAAGYLQLFVCPNVATTGTDISFTFSASMTSTTQAYVLEYSGLATSSTIDQAPAGVQGSSSAIASTAAVTTQANELLVGVTDSNAIPTASGTYSIPTSCPSPTPCRQNAWWNETYWDAIVNATGSYQIKSTNSLNWSALAVSIR
jgi:hypothetical protein